MSDKKEQIFPGIMMSKMEDAIFQMKQSLPMMIEYQKYLAKLSKAKYDALIFEGFTKEQAIELCKGIK